MALRALFVGTYTRPAPYLAQSTGDGIHSMSFDDETGALAPLGVTAGVESPSFLAISPDGDTLHAVWEVLEWPTGLVSSYRVDRTDASLTFLGLQSTHGALACYVTVDARQETAYVANYQSGTVAALPVGAGGLLREARAIDQHQGSGPDPERQEGPHAHCIVLAPDERFAFSADLGIDAVLGYPVDGVTGLNAVTRCDMPAGFGPRHLAFHPSGRFAYVIGELSCQIAALAYDPEEGTFTIVEIVDTLPSGWRGTNHCADIHVHPGGRWAYGSNRGHDSIAVFAVDADTGALSPIGHRSTDGATPRNFALSPDARFLITANQDSDTVVVMTIDANTGMPTGTVSTATVPTPACVLLGPPIDPAHPRRIGTP